MLTYAFVIDDGSSLGEATIIVQDSQEDPPNRWHLFDRVSTTNALLFVESLNENEKKNV